MGVAPVAFTHATPASPTYAGFGERLGAKLIDAVIVAAVVIPLIFVLGGSDISPLAAVLSSGLSLSYLGVLDGRGGTLGKRLLGLRVVDAQQQAPGLGRGHVRHLLPFGLNFLSTIVYVAVIPALFDGLSMLRHPERQTWHDRMAGTYVVKT